MSKIQCACIISYSTTKPIENFKFIVSMYVFVYCVSDNKYCQYSVYQHIIDWYKMQKHCYYTKTHKRSLR